MDEQDSKERFREGMKLAASRARELSQAMQNRDWIAIAQQLDNIRKQADAMMFNKALTRKEVLNEIDRQTGKAIDAQEATGTVH